MAQPNQAFLGFDLAEPTVEFSDTSLEDSLEGKVDAEGNTAPPPAGYDYPIIEILRKAQKDLSTLAEESAQNAIRAGETAGSLAKEKGIRDAAEDSRALKASIALRTNLDDPSQIITELAQEVLTRQSRVKDTLLKIQKKENTPVFDDIGSAFSALLTLPSDRATLATEEALYQNATRSLQELNQLTQQTVATQKQITPSTSAEKVALEVQAAATNANELANRARQNAVVRGATMEGTIARFVAAQSAKREVGDIKAKALEERAALDKELVENTRFGYKLYNDGRELNLTDQEILIRAKRNKDGVPTDPAILNLLDTGRRSQLLGKRNYADSPAEAALRKNSVKGSFPGNMRGYSDIVDSVVATADKDPLLNDPAVPLKNRQANLMNYIDSNVGARLAEYAKDIKPADGSNPYQIPAPSVILLDDLGANVVSTPFAKKVLAPLLDATKQDKLSPQTIVDQATNAVREKKITFPQAVDGITKYFQAGIAINNREGTPEAIGIPNQSSYNTRIVPRRESRAGRVSVLDSVIEPTRQVYDDSDELIDLSNPVDVGLLLAKDRQLFLRPDSVAKQKREASKGSKVYDPTTGTFRTP